MSQSPQLTGDLTSSAITRLVIVAGVLASFTSLILVPGSHGLAPQATVDLLDGTSTTLTFFSLSLLLTISFRTLPALFRSHDVRVTAAMIGVSIPIAALLIVRAIVGPLPPAFTAALMVVSLTSAGLGSVSALRLAPTRAGGLALLCVCAGAGARALSVVCAELAAEQARMGWFVMGRALSTAQLAASFILLGLIAVWMATRSKVGLAMVIVVVIVSAIGMWGASRGSVPEAARWQSWLNGALATPRPPESYFGTTLPVLLDLVALGFALSCAFLPRSRETLPMALCALCQGTLDVPWRALAACAAAAWLVAHLEFAPRMSIAPPPGD